MTDKQNLQFPGFFTYGTMKGFFSRIRLRIILNLMAPQSTFEISSSLYIFFFFFEILYAILIHGPDNFYGIKGIETSEINAV